MRPLLLDARDDALELAVAPGEEPGLLLRAGRGERVAQHRVDGAEILERRPALHPRDAGRREGEAGHRRLAGVGLMDGVRRRRRLRTYRLEPRQGRRIGRPPVARGHCRGLGHRLPRLHRPGFGARGRARAFGSRFRDRGRGDAFRGGRAARDEEGAATDRDRRDLGFLLILVGGLVPGACYFRPNVERFGLDDAPAADGAQTRRGRRHRLRRRVSARRDAQRRLLALMSEPSGAPELQDRKLGQGVGALRGSLRRRRNQSLGLGMADQPNVVFHRSGSDRTRELRSRPIRRELNGTDGELVQFDAQLRFAGARSGIMIVQPGGKRRLLSTW